MRTTGTGMGWIVQGGASQCSAPPPKACIIAYGSGNARRVVGYQKAIAPMWIDIIIIAISVAVLFICGFMESIGTRTPVLMLNRVPFRRSVYHWAVFAGLQVLWHLLWAASIWALAWLVYGHTADFAGVVVLIAISYLPYFFGFLFLLPYLGPLLMYSSGIFSLAIALLLIGLAYGLDPWQAIVCVFAGWLLLRLLERWQNTSAQVVQQWLWHVTTGLPVRQEQVPPVLTLAQAEQRSREEQAHAT